MKICVHYQDGRIDEFSTETFCCPEPFKASGINVMTEVQLRLDMLLANQGLCCELYWYDGKYENIKDIEPVTTPDGVKLHPAQRYESCIIRLIGVSESQGIARVEKDGELIAWRQGGEFVIGDKLTSQQILWYSDESTPSINRRALALFDYLQKANAGSDVSDEQIANMIGYSFESIQKIRDNEKANVEETRWDDDEDGGSEPDAADDPNMY